MSALHQSTAATRSSATRFLDAAAEFELDFRGTEEQVQALQRDKEQLLQRLDLTRRWLLAIRKSHRTASHAATAKVIAQAIASLDPAHPVVVPLF